MNTDQNAKTVAVKCCTSCARGLLDSDLFCRWCGVRQADEAHWSTFSGLYEQRIDSGPGVQPAGLRNRVSGPLINAVIGGMTPHAANGAGASFLRASILTLVAIPMWLMILLLSPFDAYAAARSLARQI